MSFVYGYAVYTSGDCFGVIEGTKTSTPEEAAAIALERGPYLSGRDALIVVPVWRCADQSRWTPCGSRKSAVLRIVSQPTFEVIL